MPTIPDPCTDRGEELNYIHNNQVQKKWKLAELPETYHYSSARYYFENVDDFGFLTHYKD